jgi:hypothetical protein
MKILHILTIIYKAHVIYSNIAKKKTPPFRFSCEREGGVKLNIILPTLKGFENIQNKRH